MIFHTESGSSYEVSQGMIRRVNFDRVKRADGAWLELVETPVVEVGRPVIIRTEPLRKYGKNDFNNPADLVGDVSTRITTPVVSID